ncbi:hypothetical protein A6E05_01430 [Aliivibrio sp. 1S165]|uniref:DUF3081 domain-containing protein n=1 Tax=unclassified Aliivibrio TaxID=2645654 RepID=UPI00080EA184|nr:MULTISPECIES: DUF3081 domain-containing protein [unclassified Aliivibrio]OCH19040.1 hypothetical protein A6E05_01430 [Aliivibrio sp. 1S165]OCH30766.1 hypothetical protein A6E06_04080 [Aliivibrio sp. 1S175]
MDSRLTTKEFLRVFDCVRSSGDLQNTKYHLDDICAWHDYDGYTCWLGYKDVIVTLMFHGSLKIEFDKSSNYSYFTKQCLAIITENHCDKKDSA